MQEKNIELERFSINLRKFRQEKGLSQMEVAVSLNIPRSLYLRYESTKNTPDIRLSSLIKLARYFNKSLDEFIN